jgi:hypothetical protein
MARRFEATVYSEKGREFKLYITDANYSGVINPIRLELVSVAGTSKSPSYPMLY